MVGGDFKADAQIGAVDAPVGAELIGHPKRVACGNCEPEIVVSLGLIQPASGSVRRSPRWRLTGGKGWCSFADAAAGAGTNGRAGIRDGQAAANEAEQLAAHVDDRRAAVAWIKGGLNLNHASELTVGQLHGPVEPRDVPSTNGVSHSKRVA